MKIKLQADADLNQRIVRAVRQRHPKLIVLMLTVYDDDEVIFDALCAGASGYLLKKTRPARLLDCAKEALIINPKGGI